MKIIQATQFVRLEEESSDLKSVRKAKDVIKNMLQSPPQPLFPP